MLPTTLRRASPADAPILADIHVRSRAATYRGLLPDDYLELRMPAEMPVYWQARMDEPTTGAAWIAEHDGTPIAFVYALVPDPAGSVLVDNLHALPDRKGGGAGTLLLDAVAAWACAQGAVRLHLFVIEGNAAAAGFYEHRGWSLVDRIDDEMGGQAIVALKYALALAA